METENWKPVVGYEWLYEVSSIGRVKSLKFGQKQIKKLLKISYLKNKWYSYVNLTFNWIQTTYRIHRLVAIAFIPNPLNLICVCHKDETQVSWRLNNSVENLWWWTHKDNTQDCHRKWRAKVLSWTNHPNKWKFWIHSTRFKIINQYDLNWNFIREWWCAREAERALWIFWQNIWSACIWKQKTAGWFIWKFK